MGDDKALDFEHELLKWQFREISKEHDALVKCHVHDREAFRHHRKKLEHKMLELREHAERLKARELEQRQR